MSQKRQNKIEHTSDDYYPLIGEWNPIEPSEEYFRFKKYKEFCHDLSEEIGRNYRLNDSQTNKLFELLQSFDIKLGHRPSFLGHAPKSKAKLKKIDVAFLESMLRDLDLLDFATSNNFPIFDEAAEVIKVLIVEAGQGKLNLDIIDDFVQKIYGVADNTNVKSANSSSLQFDSVKLDEITPGVFELLKSFLKMKSTQNILQLTSETINATIKNKYSYHFNLSAKNVSDMIVRHKERESKFRKRTALSSTSHQKNNISKTEILLTPGRR